MLSRPYQAQGSSADRSQVAALYGLGGLFAGVIIVAVLFCLYTVTQQLHDQTQVIERLEKSVQLTDQTQTATLEALLGPEEGGNPRKFVERSSKLLRDLEKAKDTIKDKEIVANLALAEAKKLTGENEQLRKDKEKLVEEGKKKQLEYEADHTKAVELSEQLTRFQGTNEGQLSMRYSTALYAAIAGWAVAILSSLALLGVWIAKTPIDESSMPRPGSITVPISGVSPGHDPKQKSSPPEEPPHQIV